MRLITIIIFFVFGNHVVAQQTPGSYDWDPARKLYSLTSEEDNFQEYVLKAYRGYQYRWEGDNLITYFTDHRIIRVKTSNAIERHNRIYISMRNVQDIVLLKARSISKAGKITLFDQKNLKEVKDDKSDNTYRIFAIEGVETESEIEYLYTLKMNGRTQESYYFQQETPIRDFSFLLVSPKSLSFDFRVYNDAEKVKSDTLKGQNRYMLSLKNIEGLHHEDFTFVDAYRKRMEFKLAYNFQSSTARLNTWADAGRVFYRSLTEEEGSIGKPLDKLISTLKDNPKADLVTRIKNIEDKIKTLIRINENSSDPAFNNPSAILKSMQASAEGITKILFMTYERVGIPVYLVVTCNREYGKFDGGFDTWAYLDDYLLYFPQTEGFLVPDNFDLRYPLITKNLSGHQGLFIEPVKVDNLKTGITWIKQIPALPYTADSDNLDIDVRFDESLENNNITHKRSFTGYDAASIVPYYQTMSEEQRKKFVDELFRSSIPDLQLDKWSVNTSIESLMPKIEITANYSTNFFVERAGPRILFKVGELIGPQSELYSEEKRKLPIENTHNRAYERVIRFTIPKGYAINNLDALKIRVEYKEGVQIPFLFVSDYTQQGSMVTVKISEYYKQLYASLDRYEDFRKVINAAADFNKITLVLMKQ